MSKLSQKNDMLYEFTLTIHPKYYKSNPISQYTQTKEIFLKLYKKGYFNKFKISIVAELTSVQNVHYHCLVDIMTLADKTEFLNIFRPFNIFGKKSISQVVNEPVYREYMQKSLVETAEVLENCPIIVDENNVFTDVKCICTLHSGLPVCGYKCLKPYDIIARLNLHKQ